MDQRLSHVEESIHRKVDALRVLIVENEAEHEKLSREAQYFQRRALTHKRAVESYRHWIMSAMDAAGLQRAGERFPLRIQANGRPTIEWTKLMRIYRMSIGQWLLESTWNGPIWIISMVGLLAGWIRRNSAAVICVRSEVFNRRYVDGSH
jgi:hypothetical protein